MASMQDNNILGEKKEAIARSPSEVCDQRLRSVTALPEGLATDRRRRLRQVENRLRNVRRKREEWPGQLARCCG